MGTNPASRRAGGTTLANKIQRVGRAQLAVEKAVSAIEAPANSPSAPSVAPSGAAGGDLTGTFPSPAVTALTESGGQRLSLAAIAAGQMLVRSGTTIVGQAVPTALPPSGAASGDLAGTYPAPTISASSSVAVSAASSASKLAAGISITITTAQLTSLGSQGSMTFTNGVLTSQVAAT